MKITFKPLFSIVLAMSILGHGGVAVSGETIVLKAQAEYSVQRGGGLRLKEKKELSSEEYSDEGGCGTPDLGLNGSLLVGKLKKITISGKFDATFNDLKGSDISIGDGSSIIVFDCLEKLVLQKE